MSMAWSLGLMGIGLAGAILGAAAYRSGQRLAAVMLLGVALLLVGSVGLLVTLW